MKYIFTPLFGLLVTLFGFLAPLYMLVLVWFIRWDKAATYANSRGPDEFDSSLIIRGDLPGIFKWAQTGDCRFPMGAYEPAEFAIYQKYGKMIASYHWCGWRNRAQGLSFMLGKPAIGHIPDPNDKTVDQTGWNGNHFERSEDGVWKHLINCGFFRLEVGNQVYRKTDGSFVAVPLFTARKI